MTSDRDDDALSWGGEVDDPSYLDGSSPAAGTAPAPDTDTDAGEPVARANPVLLVAYGVFGGVYLLYSIGWVLAVQRNAFAAANLFTEIMYQFGEFLAIISPLLFFGLVFLLTRGRRPAARLLLLAAGAALLAPWPFLVGGLA